MATFTSHDRSRVAAGVLVLTLGTATGASAHAHLKSAIPAAGATVAAAPGSLDLTFSEGLSLAFTGVAVTGPDKAAVATGKATLAQGSDHVLVVPLPATLPAGAYRVDWHALSSDGHRTTGSYSFTIKP